MLVESVKDYAIFMLDPDGNVITWNSGAMLIKGYEASEIVGKHHSTFYPPEDVAAGKPAVLLEAALRNGRVEDEGWRIRKDGSRFWADVVITALYERRDQLRGYAKVTRDLTKTKEVQRELDGQASQLRDAARRKDEFLAMLSHELRNPLAPLRSAVDLLNLIDPLPPKLQMIRDTLNHQVGQLSRLVNDLLDVSRITTGKIHLQRSDIDLSALVRRAAEAFHPQMADQRQEFSVSIAGEALWVSADSTRLEQVVVNMLSNASKYTPEGGHVRVTLAGDGGEAVIRVKDDGIGMEPSLLPDIFAMFSQGGRESNPEQSGLGIGLSLVKKLVEMHGGTVAAASDGPGKGSEFVVRLPLVLSSGEEPRFERSAGTGTLDGEHAFGSQRVLVVDDNRDGAMLLSMLLRQHGYAVQTVYDGATALQSAIDFRPHVVVLDIGLPGMNGYEVARLIHQQEALRNVVLIALTGYGHGEDLRRAREAGFDHHLVKPADFKKLQGILASIKNPGP